MFISPLNISPLSSGSVGGAAFTPASLNPSLWLEAGTANYTLDPTNISSWNATTGDNATQSVSGERPAPITFNGDPFVQCDESSLEHLDMGNPYQGLFRSDFTMYFIVKPDTLGANFQFVFGQIDAGSTQLVYAHFDLAGTLTVQLRSGAVGTLKKATTTTVYNTANAYIIEINHDTTAKQINIYTNGVLETLDATNNGDTTGLDMSIYTMTDNLYLNARNFNGADGLHGDNSFGDIIFTPDLLTAQERADLGTYYV